jgi:hypothetical protein
MFAKTLLLSLILCLPASNAFASSMRAAREYNYVPVMGLFCWYELNGDLKWIGLFANTLLEDTRGFERAHAEAEKVRNATIVKTVSMALVPALLFGGVAALNNESSLGVPLVASAFGSFAVFIGSDIYAKALVRRTATHFNREQSEYDGFTPGLQLDFAFRAP